MELFFIHFYFFPIRQFCEVFCNSSHNKEILHVEIKSGEGVRKGSNSNQSHLFPNSTVPHEIPREFKKSAT